MARMKMVQAKSVLKTFVVCAVLAGLCLGAGACNQTKLMREAIDKRAGEAEKALESTQTKIPNPVNYDPLTVTNKIWSGNAARRMHRGIPLPERYEEERGVTLVSSEPMTLNDIAGAISAQTGIPVRLSALSLPGRSGTVTSATPSTTSTSSAMGASSSSSDTEASMPISYEGPLSGLLNRLSAYYGISWRFDGSAILISRYETRIFIVEAMPGTIEINEGMQDDNNSNTTNVNNTSASTSNTLTQNSSSKMELKYWDELTTVLTSMVGSQGSAIISPTMGTVTITTTPEIMATVADYIAKENKRLTRQIAINVQVYNVSLGKSEDYDSAFTAFLKKINNISYTSAGMPGVANTSLTVNDFGALNVAILNNSTDGKTSATSIFYALSTIGDTSQVAQFPMTTLNNRPVSRRIGTDTSFISSVDTNTTSSTSTTTTYTPVISTIHDGFSLQLTPRLLDDGRILLQYSLSLIGISDMGSTTFNTGGNGNIPISLPVTDNRIFVQQSMLRSGQTLVIGGVDQEKITQNKQGVGSPDNILFGGGASSNETRLMMFLAITPQVMDVTLNEERG
ncbi:MAG: secretin N-terminal domain-containing protein [Bdellovibrionales bacterium]